MAFMRVDCRGATLGWFFDFRAGGCFSGLCLSLEGGSAPVAFYIHFEDGCVVNEAVDGGQRHGGIPEYHIMPLILIGESLTL